MYKAVQFISSIYVYLFIYTYTVHAMVQEKIETIYGLLFVYLIFVCFFLYPHNLDSHILACEEEWRRLAQSAAESRLLSPGMQTLTAQPMRTQTTPLGAPLILSPRMSVPTTAASLLSASQQTMEHPGLIYATPYGDYTNYAALAGNPLLTEYADHSGGLFAR